MSRARCIWFWRARKLSLAVAVANLLWSENGSRAQEAVAPIYIFSTRAGQAGSVVNSLDGIGPAAQFDAPRGLAVDRAGNVFVADSQNDTIRRITPSGDVTTFAGVAGAQGNTDGIGSAARFIEPYAVAVDASGNLFVANTSNHSIRRITPAGDVTTLAGGNGPPGNVDGVGRAARFREPRGIAVDATGNIFVGDYGNETVRKVTPGGVVTTLAGLAGNPGGNDGPGSSARFKGPHGVAVDGAGNVYVADTANRVIRRISAAGVVSTFAGVTGASGDLDGAAGTARFSEPVGVALDGTGNVFVADQGNHTVRRITAGGIVSTLAGLSRNAGSADGPSAAARFSYPYGVAVDASGNVFVGDTANNTIRRISSDGAVITLAGQAGRTSSVDGAGNNARFQDPYAVAADGAGTIYVAEFSSHAIRRITADGMVATLAGHPGTPGNIDGAGAISAFNYPAALALDSAGSVYVADSANHTIRKVTADGAVTTLAGATPASRFGEPHGIAIDRAGNVFVVDSAEATIRKISPSGEVSTFAGLASSVGSADGIGSAARFNVPRGLGLDGIGNLYVVDHGNHTVRKISPAGTVTTLAGLAGVAGSVDGIGAAARFTFPSALAVSSDGSVYVADTDNHAIRKISPTGEVTTIGGLLRRPGSSDGTAGAARFFNPKGVALDSQGRVIVADRGNHTIRRGLPVAADADGPTRLGNLSIRTPLGAGQTLVVGFVVAGGARPILVRAAGPALNALGVSGVLVDPRIELFRGETKLWENDDWNAGLAETFAAVGAFPFSPGSRDAALLQPIDGPHTVQVRGLGSGVVLVEAYDTGPLFSPRLVNLSARGRAGTGAEVLTAGFFVAGTGVKQILLRAVGPGLAAFGGGASLADPRLALFDAQGVLIGENDDWSGALAPAFARVGAFALPAGSRDAALIAAIDAGRSYTVQVIGADGVPGEALVEIYEVP